MFEYQLWLYYLNRPSDNWSMVAFRSSKGEILTVLDMYMSDSRVWDSISQYRIVKVEIPE